MGNGSLEGGQPKKTMGNQKLKTACPKGKLVKKQVSNTDSVFTVKLSLLDIEIRQRSGHCMRRHVTSEREPCAFKKSYEAKQLS